ncbi:MAG TPA: CocE/NonD family hydrolase [Lacibacter sp.]|nr:CocE/NonD family hydrolase [Lacibacter sp.]HMO90416.1 CocE/NonD family hydrolase [Lacibacter sp.]
MRQLFLLLALCAGLWATAQTNVQDSAWIRDNYIKKEIMIPMRDGVRLFTTVYIPRDTSEAHPILMTRTPYSCAPYGEQQFRAFWNNHWRYYMRRNYIIVLQDVRGRWMSEGTFMDVRPFNPNKKGNEVDEASDTYDAIDWLVNNLAHNNKKVGIFGISYPGFYSTMAALSNHPSLVAVSPQAPVTDWYMGDDFHHNGAFFQMDGFAFYSSFGKPRLQPTTVGSPGFNFPTRDAYKFYLDAGTPKKLAELIGDSIAFWHEMYRHPDYDDWWKARNVRNFVQHIPKHTNTLVVGGLFDAEDTYGAWRTYEAIEQKAKNNNRIVMGPWYHGQWSRTDGSSLGNVQFGSNTSLFYQNEIELPFFIHHLEGRSALPQPAEATIFFTGENQWRQFERWPAAGVQPTALYLQPGERLSWQAPVITRSFSEYTSDPAKPVPYTEDVHFSRTIAYMTDDQRFANRRTDVLSFQTDVLTEDVTLGGTVIADLLTSISTTDADFVVKLIDVFPSDFRYPGQQQAGGRLGGGSYPMGDYQMLVRGEIMRGRYRNSFEKPAPFVPNKVERVKFELPDVAHTFKKGHRIMIQVQSSWFPLADRNPQQFVNIYQAEPNDYIKSTIRIWHDAKNASSIILPVLK